MKQLDIEMFRECCALTFSVRRWSNRKTLRLGSNDSDSEQVSLKRIRKTIKLTNSKVYKEICEFQNATKIWLIQRSMPSFFKMGVFMVKISEMDAINSKLEQDSNELKQSLVPKLVADIKECEYVDRQELGPYYSESDYPQGEDMERRFGFTWLPMSFGVPENLPRKLFEEAKVKAENMWADAQEKILVALRMSFLGLVEHAAERLKVEPGEKAKIFKSSTIGNIKEFLEVFSAKNILNDKELEGFVKQAEQVMLDVGDVSEFSESIRDDESMRNSMAQKFEQIKEGVSGMIMSRPARVFDLEVDDES